MKWKHQDIAWAATGASSVGVLLAAGIPAPLVAAAAAAAAWTAAQHARRAERRTQLTAAAMQQAHLQQALQRRDQQLAYTAHELRTPLSCVVTALELLREGHASTPAETAEFLDQATLAAHHLGFLVNDVLDDAALVAGQLRLHRRDHRLVDLLATAREVIGLQARSRGIALQFASVPPDLAVHTDARRFLQILFNLLGNALKFTAPGELVQVAVEPRGPSVRCLVVDRGAGVPQAARERLFAAFGCAPVDPGQAVPGTGLGLHFCRRLVEQLGGRIGYHPGSDCGSVFWFELPAAVGTATAARGADSTIAPDTVPAR